MNIERIKERIRKLFNLASNDAAAEGEITNALKAAHELMLAHQLSEDDVAAEEQDLRTPEQIAADTEYGTARSWADTSRVPRWQGVLATAVMDFIGTVGCYCHRPEIRRDERGFVLHDGEAVSSYVFFGPEDDARLASELHAELVLTCAATAKLRYGGKLMKGEGRDYCDGFASGLCDKIHNAKVEVGRAAIPKLEGKQCTALAIVRAGDIAIAKRKRAVKWLRETRGVRLGSAGGGGRDIGNYSAFRQGHADGGSQTLSKQRIARIGQR